jgi:HK97 family phage portal protein
MMLLSRLGAWFKQHRAEAPVRTADHRAATLFTPPYPAGGSWAGDATEQLRHYTSWVYAAVNAIAQEVAKQRPLVFLNTGQAAHEQTPLPHTHPLCELLDNPNPWLTAWELWYLTVVNLELTGNCFWYIATDQNTGAPAELWIVPTPWVKVLPDKSQYVRGYEVNAPGARAELFRPDEFIHLKYPNPLDPHRGLSPMQANALTVDANTELMKSRYQTFLAGPRPGLVLHTDQVLTDITLGRLEQKLESKYSGRGNWHRPMVLEQGLKASPWTLSPAEMDFLNSAKMTRDEILAVFRVPAPITGLAESTGLGSNIWQGARTMFCEGTVQPKLELLSQALSRDLARRFGPDVRLRFPDCSPRNQEQRRLDDELDARMGLRTYNEIRQGRGLPPLSDPRFDVPMVPHH